MKFVDRESRYPSFEVKTVKYSLTYHINSFIVRHCIFGSSVVMTYIAEPHICSCGAVVRISELDPEPQQYVRFCNGVGDFVMVWAAVRSQYTLHFHAVFHISHSNLAWMLEVELSSLQ